VSSKIKKLLKRGIAKVSESTKSWIITNGSSTGVSKIVGEALAENPRFTQYISIGILNLNRVGSGEDLNLSAQQADRSNIKQVLSYVT
jgi:hypothetical protein